MMRLEYTELVCAQAAAPEILADESFKVADAMLEKYKEKMKRFGADE